LHLWYWEKAKLLGSIRTTTPNEKIKDNKENINQVIYQSLINPNDSSLVSVIGNNGIFKLYRLSEGLFKIASLPKIDGRNIVSHCWTLDDRILCGMDDGKVMIFESNGEFKTEFQHMHSVDQTPRSIRTIVPFSKGMLFGCDGGTVAYYEKGDDINLALQLTTGNGKDVYRKIREYGMVDDVSNISKLCISPNEDSFVCSTDSSQMFYTLFSNTEVKVLNY
jgi:hypothetical protein